MNQQTFYYHNLPVLRSSSWLQLARGLCVCVCVCVGGWGGVCEVCGCGRWTATYPWGSSSGYASCSQDEADTAPGQIHVHIHTVHAIKALQHWRQNSLVTLRGD